MKIFSRTNVMACQPKLSPTVSAFHMGVGSIPSCFMSDIAPC